MCNGSESRIIARGKIRAYTWKTENGHDEYRIGQWYLFCLVAVLILLFEEHIHMRES